MSTLPGLSSTHAADIAVVEAQSLAPDHAPLCFVIDAEPSIRHFLSLVLHGSGADTVEFANGVNMRKALQERVPDLVFLDVGNDTSDAIDSLTALAKRGFRGRVQLMSARGSSVTEHVKTVGLDNGLMMLAALKKPFETGDVIKVTKALQLGYLPSGTARIDLDEALSRQWIDLWLQPKIHLRKKQLVGVEGFARARHPHYGVLLPTTFLQNAPSGSLVKLAEHTLTAALKASLKFSELGISLRLAVNMPAHVLVKAPVEDIVRAYRPDPENWSGLIIDVPEAEIINDLPLANALAKRLERYNVRLALDDFGRGCSALAKLKELPFTELKLDRSLVAGCGNDKVNAPICKAAVAVAHHFERVAVGVGVEKAADAFALVSMGCDYGQGYLLGQPMPQERFLSLLRQRKSAQASSPTRPLEPSEAVAS
jgi:EAL domain-containing protein (putative c-di-GMP-specific phosphodiesterase class I)